MDKSISALPRWPVRSRSGTCFAAKLRDLHRGSFCRSACRPEFSVADRRLAVIRPAERYGDSRELLWGVLRGRGWAVMALCVQPSRAGAILLAGLIVLTVGGCETDGVSPWPDTLFSLDLPFITKTVQDPDAVKYYPSDEPMRLGLEYFNRGNFGLAERYFRDAVEKAPRDLTAWVGLAASYDRIGRFDLADRAYAQAIRLVGETTDILNNLGYSYMLRGNYPAARKKFIQALKREPRNPTILNNLRLLDSSWKSTRRIADP